MSERNIEVAVAILEDQVHLAGDHCEAMGAMTSRLPPQGQAKTSKPQVRSNRSAQSGRWREEGRSACVRSC